MEKIVSSLLFSESAYQIKMIILRLLSSWIKLKSYEFKKYKSKKETRIITINILGKKNKPTLIVN